MSDDGPVVVGILTHRDPPQVSRLVDRVLQGERSVVVVHHDPRGPALSLPDDDRVVLVPSPRPADWGRMGIVDAQLRTLETAVAHVPDLSWFLLVSGQDYPVRHMRAIEAELAASTADAFVRHFRADGPPERDVHHWQAVTRRRYLRRVVFPGSARSVPMPRRHPFRSDLGLWVGDLWVNLGSVAARHVLAQRSNHPELMRYFATTPIPDEAVLPTLLLNDDPAIVVDGDHRRHISWSGNGKHPDTLTMEDLPVLVQSSAFFARKFDPTVDAVVLDRLDEHAAATGP